MEIGYEKFIVFFCGKPNLAFLHKFLEILHRIQYLGSTSDIITPVTYTPLKPIKLTTDVTKLH